jgi:hypothetical protein
LRTATSTNIPATVPHDPAARPAIAATPSLNPRRPAVVGTGLDVWEIVEVAKDNRGAVADTAACLEIDPRLVETASR